MPKRRGRTLKNADSPSSGPVGRGAAHDAPGMKALSISITSGLACITFLHLSKTARQHDVRVLDANHPKGGRPSHQVRSPDRERRFGSRDDLAMLGTGFGGNEDLATTEEAGIDRERAGPEKTEPSRGGQADDRGGAIQT